MPYRSPNSFCARPAGPASVTWAAVASAFLFLSCTEPVPGPPAIRIILVGDSTMASGSGYGDAFCKRLVPQVTCINAAAGGTSSMSYRSGGLWDQVMVRLADRGAFAATYVLIEFGHNDRPDKPGRSTDLATEFPANLARYVDEVRKADATPVLVTPLTRREFQNFRLKRDLSPWADATRRVAAETGTALLDLYADSSNAVERMGPAAANQLAMMPPPAVVVESETTGTSARVPRVDPPGPQFDYTHIGAEGADVFSKIVVAELAAALPDLRAYVSQPADVERPR